jgi:hypothetical protein
MTVRMNITMDDDLAARLRVASGDRLSDYISQAVRRRILDDELAALPATEDSDWAATAEASAEAVMFGRDR